MNYPNIIKFFCTLTLLGYISITNFGGFHILQMAKMGMPMEDCPFSLAEHSLCQMNTFDHIKSWQWFSRSAIPELEILLLWSMLGVAFSWCFQPSPISRLRETLRKRKKIIISLYQELFSKGLLNPKAP